MHMIQYVLLITLVVRSNVTPGTHLQLVEFFGHAVSVIASTTTSTVAPVAQVTPENTTTTTKAPEIDCTSLARCVSLTGHGGFAEYLHRFKRKDHPGCVCDDSVSESIIHLLMDCPQHEAAREDLQQELRMKLCRDSVPTILGEASGRDAFLEYASKIARVAIARNRATDRDA